MINIKKNNSYQNISNHLNVGVDDDDKNTKGTGRLGSWRTGGDHPNDSIIENGQNTKKSTGDLRRLGVTQTPVKNHRLMLI